MTLQRILSSGVSLALLLRVTVIASVAPAFAGASFDCGAAKSRVEKAICANASLGDLDGEIASAYKRALERVGAHDGARSALVEMQKRFVADRNLGFSKNYAIEAHMRQQRDVLRRIAAEPGREGFLGEWRSSRGQVVVHENEKGSFSIEAQSSEQTEGKWLCNWGDEKVSQMKGWAAHKAGEALISDARAPGWSLRLTREGPMLLVAEVAAPLGASDVAAPRDFCGEHGTLAGAYFPVADDSPAPKRVMATERAMTITDYFRLLPVSAFDDTTDGLAESEKRALLDKGESENWRLTTISQTKAAIVAKHPSSEVTLVLKRLDGKDVLEAMTRNERVVGYRYWEPSPNGASLVAHFPKASTRAANETSDGSEGPPLSSIPLDVIEHVDAREKCHHLGGEFGGDGSARDKELGRRMAALACGRLDANETGLREKYAGAPRLLGVLDRARTIIGE